MKFDVERAEADFRELGDARFAGPDGEAKVVDFLAGRFESIGYRVERREAAGRGSRRVWCSGWAAWVVARSSRRITACSGGTGS